MTSPSSLQQPSAAPVNSLAPFDGSRRSLTLGALAVASVLGLALLGGGCDSRPAPGNADGGGRGEDRGGAGDGGEGCEARSTAACEDQGTCVLLPGCCGGSARCAPAGTSPVCNALCPADGGPNTDTAPGDGGVACDGLDEATCTATAGCAAFPGCCGGPSICAPDDRAPVCAADCAQLCSDLDEAGCRARPDCVTDTCMNCGCQATFLACRAPAETPKDCPQLGCPQPLCCSEQTDCQAIGGSCVAPGASFPSCGTCRDVESTCAADPDCATGDICQPVDCACSAATECVPGCSGDEQCPTGQVCGSGFRCETQPCPDNVCPANFTCEATPGTGGGLLCLRQTCSDDAGCPQGYCVEGSCYDGLGTCVQPAS